MCDTTKDQIDDDAIVISGISGSFPDCENIDELRSKLLSGTDCVAEDPRGWNVDHPNIPKRYGKMKNIERFDNLFFGVHAKLATLMDPMARLLLERSYEAILDAGINPRDIRGEDCVVFAGSSFSESEKSSFFEKLHKDGFGLLGSARAMLPNRVSFFFNFTGQSLNIDSLSAGSGVALEQACQAIKDGRCDSAVVGGISTCLFPYISLQMSRMKLLSPDGVHRAFDANAAGSTRSEAVVAMYLQKAKKAKRIYAEIAGVKSDFGKSEMDKCVFFPTPDFQLQMMKEVMKQSGIEPQDVTYVEADGSAMKKSDIAELEAIDRAYGVNRSEPLLVGSIKSNIGDCSATNTLTSMVKVIIAMREGKIPANLHFEKPPEEAKSLIEGRLKIVTELTPWQGNYAAINSITFSGVFVHVILKFHRTQKKKNIRPDGMPRLAVVCSRTEEGIRNILDYLTSHPVNLEFCQLLNDVYLNAGSEYLERGYAVLPPEGIPTDAIKDTASATGEQRSIWYVFSGMGSQWVGMGAAFMKIPIFAKAIMKCDAVLKPRGYDIVRILTDTDPKMFDNIVHCFIGIAAVQIGLVDILTAVGVKPDYIIGHSVGELGCAYADGCFDAEQMILSSLSRGLASIESELIPGSMAAVGLGYNQIKALCPPDVDIACRNSSNSVTISGPAETMKTFVASLQEKKIFAREVPCGGIAYHSRYIAPAGKKLIKYLNQVIPDPKPRSSRWISTSVPRREWNTAKARLSSAEYHTNNLLCPVLFADVLKEIPKNAILIEISPHGLLQAILKRAIHKECLNVPLAQRGNPDNVTILLSALGKLYNAEVQIDIQKLYQKIDYPVSSDTPSISPFIKWHHTTEWRVFKFQDKQYTSGICTPKIDLSTDEFQFLNDCKIDGKVVLPCGLYLHYVLSIFNDYTKPTEDGVIIFKNIHIHKEMVTVPEHGSMEIMIMLQKGSGNFEIYHGEDVLMTGNMYTDKSPEIPEQIILDEVNEKDMISQKYVYKELFMRGTEYGDTFQCVNGVNCTDASGYVTWQDNMVSFLEGLLQFQAFRETRPRLLVPKLIQEIAIDQKLHKEILKKTNKIPVHFDKIADKIVAGAIEIKGLKLSTINKLPPGTNTISQGIHFVAYQDDDTIGLEEIVQVVMELIAENLLTKKIHNIIIVTEENDDMIEALDYLKNILPSIEGTFKINMMARKDAELAISNTENIEKLKNATLVVVNDVHEYAKTHLLKNLNNENFLLTIVNPSEEQNVLMSANKTNSCLVVRKRISSDKLFMVLRKKRLPKNPLLIEVQDNWITQAKSGLNNPNYDKVIVIIRNDNDDQIFLNLRKLRNDPNGEKLQVFDLKDFLNAPPFSFQNPFYKLQLQLNLFLNVLKPHNVWGSIRRISIRLNAITTSRWTAKQLIPADPKSVECVEVLPYDEKETKNLVKVEYAGFTVEDLRQVRSERVRSFSKTYQDEYFGLDYSGIDSSGQRVMGIASEGSTTNVLIPDPIFTWAIPNSWSFEDAATVPAAYVIAYHALFTRSEFNFDDNVLVHRPASYIGQAVINLALHANYDVVATYTFESEKILLEATYPNEKRLSIIPAVSFVDYLLSKNGRNTIDIAINYADDLSDIQSTIRCVEEQQYYVIIGNMVENVHETIGLQPFLKGIHMHVVNPKTLTRMNPVNKNVLANMIKKGIKSGTVKPIVKRWIYPVESLTNVFDDYESKMYHGKILVKVQSQKQPTLAIPRAFFFNTKVYIVIDGINDFGIRTMGWLICKGARKLIVTSRGTADEYATFCLTKWRQRGISISVYENTNLSDRKRVQSLFQNLKRLGELDGIFDFQRMNTKVIDDSSFSTVTQIIDEESRSSFPNLSYFVVSCLFKFNDVISGFTSRDMVAQRVCERRKSDGLSALMILWGPIRQVYQMEKKIKGVNYIEISECLTRLDGLLKSKSLIIAVYGREDAEKEEEVIEEVCEVNEMSIFKKSLHTQRSLANGIFSDLPVE